MGDAMRLSVVIPCFNGEATLREQLDALARQEWSEAWEVVVADNGSTDSSMSIVAEYGDRLPGLRIVDASAVQGQPYALNEGAKAALGESVVFVDADDVVADGYVRAIGDALTVHELVASRHDARELNPEWLVKCRGEGQRDELMSLWYPPKFPHAGGCGLGMRRDFLARYGGFDLGLPVCHDTDMCIRLQKVGIELTFVPDATIHIRYREGLRGLYRQARSWAAANNLVYRTHRSADATLDSPWRSYFSGWKRIASRLRRIRSRPVRYILMWQLGWQVGLLEGSLRYRVPPVAQPVSDPGSGS